MYWHFQSIFPSNVYAPMNCHWFLYELAVSTVPAPVLKLEYWCKSDMGPPVIWGPPYPHITSDMGPGEAHTSSVMDLPSDIDPSPPL